MRSGCALVLLVLFSCIVAAALDARAGVTIDLVLQTGHALSLSPGSLGPGCTFTGNYGNTVPTGRCMDVVLRAAKHPRPFPWF